MNYLFCALPLNLNLVEILLHLINLAILVVAVRFLLYKPIKKFMEKRAEEYKHQDDECEQKMQSALAIKGEYEQLLAEEKQNALSVTQSTTEAAKKRADQIVAEAKQKSDEMIKKAGDEIRQKTEDEQKRLKLSVSSLAYAMASQVLSREVTEQDMDTELDSIVGKWDNA